MNPGNGVIKENVKGWKGRLLEYARAHKGCFIKPRMRVEWRIHTGVDANTKFELPVGPMGNDEGGHGLEELDSHAGHLLGVLVAITLGQTRGNHIGVSNRLHLIHVEAHGNGVEESVQLIQQLYHLHAYTEKRN